MFLQIFNVRTFSPQPGLCELGLQSCLVPFDRLAERVCGRGCDASFREEVVMDQEK